MSRRRDPYVHSEQPMNNPPSKSIAEYDGEEEEGEKSDEHEDGRGGRNGIGRHWRGPWNDVVDEPTVEECLKEIFDSPTDLESPPYSLRRSNDERGCMWSPVQTNMTPILENVGLGVDSEVYSTPTA